MSYATQTLTKELQKALASRTEAGSPRTDRGFLATTTYNVSSEVENYLQKMNEYRERAKQVRVGSY